VEITQEHRNLVKQVQNVLGEWHKFTIGIDGVDGAGKSTLARFLSWQTEISLLETDLFRVSGKDGFDYRNEDLKRIIEFRHSLNRPIIIEGIYLLQLLCKLDVKHDYLIYVEKANHNGNITWQDNITQYELKYKPKDNSDYRFCWADAS